MSPSSFKPLRSALTALSLVLTTPVVAAEHQMTATQTAPTGSTSTAAQAGSILSTERVRASLSSFMFLPAEWVKIAEVAQADLIKNGEPQMAAKVQYAFGQAYRPLLGFQEQNKTMEERSAYVGQNQMADSFRRETISSLSDSAVWIIARAVHEHVTPAQQKEISRLQDDLKNPYFAASAEKSGLAQSIRDRAAILDGSGLGLMRPGGTRPAVAPLVVPPPK